MNPRVKAVLGPAYPYYIRVRTSPFVRDVTAALGYPAYRKLRRESPGTLHIDIDTRMGLGATIAKALLFHALAEDEGVKPHIISSNSLYAASPGADFLPRYFERPVLTRQQQPLSGRSYTWALRKVAPERIPLARASDLFRRFFQPTALVTEAVEQVKQGRAGFDLSVHYRGTDKFLESGNVESNAMIAAVDQALSDGPVQSIFLATDDADFEALFRSRYSKYDIASYTLDAVPAGVPRHFSAMSSESKALEAVVNIFLLASAKRCVRTSSYLSAISRIANPAMTTRTINRTLSGSSGFPEAEVIGAERHD